MCYNVPVISVAQGLIATTSLASRETKRDTHMKREFNVLIERDEDGYLVATVPALRGCHTQAKSFDTLMKRVREAIELCLEVEKPVTNEFVGVQRIAING